MVRILSSSRNSPQLRAVALVTIAVLLSAAARTAAQPERPYSAEFNKCIDAAVATAAILDCHKREAEVWQRRMDRAYTRLMSLLVKDNKENPLSLRTSGVDAGYPRGATRASLLQSAQERWRAFRDADCLSARTAAVGGTMASVYAASCRLDHLVDRALALEDRLNDQK